MPFYYRDEGDSRPTRELPVFESMDDLGGFLDYQAGIDAEMAAEAANERFWEEGPHGGYYAGSEEEARDRWLDSLMEVNR